MNSRRVILNEFIDLEFTVGRITRQTDFPSTRLSVSVVKTAIAADLEQLRLCSKPGDLGKIFRQEHWYGLDHRTPVVSVALAIRLLSWRKLIVHRRISVIVINESGVP